MQTLQLNCRTCEFFMNGTCVNPKSEIGFNQLIERMTDEGRSCWSISLNYFSVLVGTLPLKEQRMMADMDDITVYELLERVETGSWGRDVLRRIESRTVTMSSQSPMPLYPSFGAFL
ncbi:hypothetical protein B5M42_002540 [Paenibacillus athensensis]|uniref:Uncharacterized protein n=1 Tax=Paenibacillus athensensis TaxID=1967502 RepID=A0A4Y8QA53_9BACL|nr:hypothetical protein [Paenibacillus athensensis]MCD1257717.1 hypothetical protein [Paenibacillus athensensis]